ncbi:MAG: hypothetical protein KAW12_16350 [Candidatus Aminicenantes bacterium]|nr:hypothetical protein [Candidatus Aminicenantes bacterium]
MNKDFHYCMIKVLSRLAGFKETEAQTIAYASQYVDDAVAHQEIRIKGKLPVEFTNSYSRYKKGLFDPVCTAHKGLGSLSGLAKVAQRKVYVSFHFIPTEKFIGKEEEKWDFDYTTSPDCSFAREILNKAVAAVKSGKEGKREEDLIKLGISLHSYADTWAHQKFSGRRSKKDNDIERICILKDAEWDRIGFVKQLTLNSLPEIGHAEAMTYPDMPQITWKYEHDASAIEIIRDNTNVFLEAAQKIYYLLCQLAGTAPAWKKYVSHIKECLAYDTDSMKKRFEKFRSTFAYEGIALDYNKSQWKRDALEGVVYDWDDLDEDEYRELEYKFRKDNEGNMRWFYFHKAALAQREFVMKHLP